MLKLGKYKHYKKRDDGPHYYTVLMEAVREGTKEPMVVYRSEQISSVGDPAGMVYVRPVDEFTEIVEYLGEQVPRFEYIGE